MNIIVSWIDTTLTGNLFTDSLKVPVPFIFRVFQEESLKIDTANYSEMSVTN
jgi:hypothetical protein